MSTRRPLSAEREHRRIVPRYLSEADHGWLEVLDGEFQRFVGRTRGELEARLTEPLGAEAPADKLRVAKQVLLRRYRDQISSPVPPRTIRRELFHAAAASANRVGALEITAKKLGLGVPEIREYLFADLPSERRVCAPTEACSTHELALSINHTLIARLLKRAISVRITAEGDARSLVRAAKLRGLLCNAIPRGDSKGLALEVSGPFSLFRHTLVYGRALASLLPRVARCRSFELDATCALATPADLATLSLRSGDPISPAETGKQYDSKLEERFAKDFSKLARDWELIREPESVPLSDGRFVFPDFLLRHRRFPERRMLLEIVGFWTREYLTHKLGTLRSANIGPFILCVDESRNCAKEELPADARVIRFRRRIPADEVLRILEELSQVDRPGLTSSSRPFGRRVSTR